MALIDLSNYDSTLWQASSNSFTDGNVFFDPASTGTVQFGPVETYATVNPGKTTGTITIDAAAAGTFIRTTGDFLTDGFRHGQNFTASGYVNGGNNATFTILSITTTTIPNDTITVTDNTGMVTEAGDAGESIISAVTPNPLVTLDGLKFEALYALENQERRADENLRKYDRWTSGTFKFGGAYNFIKSRKFATTADEQLIRGSGWNEIDTANVVRRKFFGVNGLGSILSTSTPYYQSTQYGTAVDYQKGGNINEAILVYEDSNGDGNPETDNTDTATTNMYLSVRTYGQNYDRIDAGGTLGIAELGGYSTGAALNESDHLTTVTTTYPLASVAPDSNIALTSQTIDFTATEVVLNNVTAADNDWVALGFGVGSSFVITGSTTAGNDTTYVISSITTTTDTNDTVVTTVAPAAAEVGTGTQTLDNVQVTPWDTMTLEKVTATFTSPAEFTGGATGTFTWRLNNVSSGNLDQCVAYLDAISQINGVVTTGDAALNGKQYDTWYEYTATGEVLPINGAGEANSGVYITNLPGTDYQRVKFKENNDTILSYPVVTPVSVDLGSGAVNDDPLAWFHCFETALWGTVGAVTYQDNQPADVKGLAAVSDPFVTGTSVNFNHDFSGDGDVNVTFLCEGDGKVTQNNTQFLLSSTAVSTTCIPQVETNV